MSVADVKFSDYSIHTLPQLHYFIEHESHSLTGKFYTNTSWNVIKSVEVDGVKFMLVETKWWAFVSHLFLNRGYRILADRQCTPNTDQLIILFEEESCAIGKQNALQQWEQKIEAVLNQHNITGNFKSIGNRANCCQYRSQITGRTTNCSQCGILSNNPLRCSAKRGIESVT